MLPLILLLLPLTPLALGLPATTRTPARKKSAPTRTVGKLDAWALDHRAGLFRDCANRSSAEILNKLKRIEEEFSKKADAADRQTLLANPEFLRMGEALFPALLPDALPNRGAFLICDDALQDVLRAAADTSGTPWKETLETLDFCYSDAYRIERPRWVRLFMDCFRDLAGK